MTKRHINQSREMSNSPITMLLSNYKVTVPKTNLRITYHVLEENLLKKGLGKGAVK